MGLHKDGKNEKGATMIIMALMAMVMVAISVTGTAALILNAKKQSKSTGTSSAAYMKAEEAAECALWGRLEALRCANSTTGPDCNFPNVNARMFPKDVSGHYCNSTKYIGNIDYFHDTFGTEVPACSSPIWITGMYSKGSEESTGQFADQSTKMRGLGVTVKTPSSATIKPFISCNKMAEYGNTNVGGRNYTGCNATNPTGKANDPGPSSPADRGWLEFWPECKGLCADPCSYYDTSLDDGKPSVYDATDTRIEGAHWCWTKHLDGISVDEGTMCKCLDTHKGDADAGLKYWKHPDIIAENFCDPCRRLEEDVRDQLDYNSCNGQDGNTAGSLCSQIPSEITDNPAYNAIWGAGGKPGDASNRGILTASNPYSCMCSAFRSYGSNEIWCEDNGM